VAYLPVAPIRAGLSIYLHCSKDFLPPEQIEGHLPEEGIYGILNNPGKAGAKSIVVQAAQYHRRFHSIPDSPGQIDTDTTGYIEPLI
jgi:hypothetical protein